MSKENSLKTINELFKEIYEDEFMKMFASSLLYEETEAMKKERLTREEFNKQLKKILK